MLCASRVRGKLACTVLRGPRFREEAWLPTKLPVEAAWSYRHPARAGKTLQPRHEGIPKAIIERAWDAQLRLCKRYRKFTTRECKRCRGSGCPGTGGLYPGYRPSGNVAGIAAVHCAAGITDLRLSQRNFLLKRVHVLSRNDQKRLIVRRITQNLLCGLFSQVPNGLRSNV
ncbi:hypothetical protein LMG29542_08250 [Paraburkholderia humisilvae]|uniref:Uncharacterized protein n=1 Tax=Paraburkholderia humisilvae TaxID=627669 RepID=A0A6J5F7I8_9BURK|nr:hypothetical protein LMG29542_08250 [Paraburkholderia humisilvae]